MTISIVKIVEKDAPNATLSFDMCALTPKIRVKYQIICNGTVCAHGIVATPDLECKEHIFLQDERTIVKAIGGAVKKDTSCSLVVFLIDEHGTVLGVDAKQHVAVSNVVLLYKKKENQIRFTIGLGELTITKSDAMVYPVKYWCDSIGVFAHGTIPAAKCDRFCEAMAQYLDGNKNMYTVYYSRAAEKQLKILVLAYDDVIEVALNFEKVFEDPLAMLCNLVFPEDTVQQILQHLSVNKTNITHDPKLIATSIMTKFPTMEMNHINKFNKMLCGLSNKTVTVHVTETFDAEVFALNQVIEVDLSNLSSFSSHVITVSHSTNSKKVKCRVKYVSSSNMDVSIFLNGMRTTKYPCMAPTALVHEPCSGKMLIIQEIDAMSLHTCADCDSPQYVAWRNMNSSKQYFESAISFVKLCNEFHQAGIPICTSPIDLNFDVASKSWRSVFSSDMWCDDKIFCAPECLSSKTIDAMNADIWSIATMFSTIYFQVPIYHVVSNIVQAKLMNEVAPFTRFPTRNDALTNELQSCWTNMTQRPLLDSLFQSLNNMQSQINFKEENGVRIMIAHSLALCSQNILKELRQPSMELLFSTYKSDYEMLSKCAIQYAKHCEPAATYAYSILERMHRNWNSEAAGLVVKVPYSKNIYNLTEADVSYLESKKHRLDVCVKLSKYYLHTNEYAKAKALLEPFLEQSLDASALYATVWSKQGASDQDELFKILKISARHDIDCQFALAIESKSEKERYFWMAKAAEQGQEDALLHLANSVDLPFNFEKVCTTLLKKNASVKCQIALATHYAVACRKPSEAIVVLDSITCDKDAACAIHIATTYHQCNNQEKCSAWALKAHYLGNQDAFLLYLTWMPNPYSSEVIDECTKAGRLGCSVGLVTSFKSNKATWQDIDVAISNNCMFAFWIAAKIYLGQTQFLQALVTQDAQKAVQLLQTACAFLDNCESVEKRYFAYRIYALYSECLEFGTGIAANPISAAEYKQLAADAEKALDKWKQHIHYLLTN